MSNWQLFLGALFYSLLAVLMLPALWSSSSSLGELRARWKRERNK